MAIHNSEDRVKRLAGPGHWGALLLNDAHGCVAGFCVGVSEYVCDDYPQPGVHEDQEGFYVVSGRGLAKVGDEEIQLRPGVVFLAKAGVPHTIKKTGDEAVKVVWAHGAI